MVEPVNFDHKHVTAVAHVLLSRGRQTVRKMCFNSYNGSFGKNSRAEELETFLSGGAGDWSTVASLDKERTKLQRNGYKLESAQTNVQPAD